MGLLKNWETAANYQFIHSFALIIAGLISKDTIPTSGLFFLVLFFCTLFIINIKYLFFIDNNIIINNKGGISLFSGSLYLMTLTGQKWLGAITPIGISKRKEKKRNRNNNYKQPQEEPLSSLDGFYSPCPSDCFFKYDIMTHILLRYYFILQFSNEIYQRFNVIYI